MFLSKCCEKVVASQFISHLRENKLEGIFQSAYKVGHSTESALLRVHNDVLCALDDGRCVMLVLLNLSAAFDTVGHGILLSRLSQCIGVQGSAYTWFEAANAQAQIDWLEGCLSVRALPLELASI